MKYINTNKLTDGQYEDLSKIVSQIQIVDNEVIGERNFVWREFTVEDLKEDSNQVIYAPTKLVDDELGGYTPLFEVIMDKCNRSSEWQTLVRGFKLPNLCQ